MAFLAENYSSHKHKDALWPSLGHDASPGPQVIQHNTADTRFTPREYREDYKLARVHFYLERGKDRRKDGILRCINCGQTRHTKTDVMSVFFPEFFSDREIPDNAARFLHQDASASTSRYTTLSYLPHVPPDHYICEVSDAKVTLWLTSISIGCAQ
jgi:hypothetical protein